MTLSDPLAGSETSGALRLRLPATSANLGPGFDTLALALELYLTIEARPATDASGFSIEATGRDAGICSRLEGNLLLTVYRDTVLTFAGREAPPLALTMHNGIPLAMGCGSSAASRLAGLALASHFGGLGWSGERILAEAARLEGHPDNAAACWLGGFVASGWDGPRAGIEHGGGPVAGKAYPGSAAANGGPATIPVALSIAALSIAPPASWRALLVLPELPLATSASRAVLPEQYSCDETVENLQRVAVLTAAFAAGRGDLLAAATRDRLHQPYRSAVCPLLPLLLPLAGHAGILSVTLSGAGPAVLLLLEDTAPGGQVADLVRERVGLGGAAAIAELIFCGLATCPATVEAVSVTAA